MNKKMLQTLEYNKVLDRLASYTSFAVSNEKAKALNPSTDLDSVRQMLAETSEARRLIADQPQTTIGGARDIHGFVTGASRGKILVATELIDIKSTLIAARTLGRQLSPTAELYPFLFALKVRFPE